MTPAMAAGVTDRVWEIADLVRLLGAKEARLVQAKQARKSFKDAKIGPAPRTY
jgi:hypothetical protein